ncbi:MAG: TOMM precursor leader peptide-binding protein [Vicinamibacteria bacterium]
MSEGPLAETRPADEARPRFAGDFYLVPLGPQAVQLRAGEKVLKLSGPDVAALLERLLPRLTGRHSLREIAEQAGAEDRPRVRGLVATLLENRVLHDARDEDAGRDALTPDEEERHAGQIRFFGHFQRDPRQQQAALKKATVGVLGAGRLAAALTGLLYRSGIGAVLTGELDAAADAADLLFSCAEEPSVGYWETVNAASLRTGTPWLRCSLDGYKGLVGPLVIPYETACYRCCRLRERSNARNPAEHNAFESWLEEHPDHGVRYGGLSPFEPIVAGYAALEAVRLLTRITALESPTVGHLLVVDLLTYETERHRVLKVPRCAACGQGRGRASRKAWSE